MAASKIILNIAVVKNAFWEVTFYRPTINSIMSSLMIPMQNRLLCRRPVVGEGYVILPIYFLWIWFCVRKTIRSAELEPQSGVYPGRITKEPRTEDSAYLVLWSARAQRSRDRIERSSLLEHALLGTNSIHRTVRGAVVKKVTRALLRRGYWVHATTV